MANNYKKCEIKKAIDGSFGLMSTIAKKLGCNWHTAKKYVDKFDLTKELEAEREKKLDFTETMHLQNIKAGDTASIIFTLKTLGRNRGYSEKQNIDITTNGESVNSEPPVIKFYKTDDA